MFQKVLVPMDGSELAEQAMSHVRSILREGSAGEVTLLHIKKIDIPPGFDPKTVRGPVFAAANKYLGEMESRMVSAGVKVKTKVLEANRPANTITEYAQKQRHGPDRDVNPRLYRPQKAAAGKRGRRSTQPIPCSRAPDPT